ncbi:GNAT family N-acetyltransferase [uncultured Tateyamaria sp.]|uniref:GNAT family N-acetyltransferase n=1 Tax=uncultured Tateyamaria sp. TaxID=455651 RepID=UPI002620A5A0|nr:GNAT family N-acetyltransferase [uncultured Tateyamaria sp.]
MTMLVRDANPGDATSIAALHARSWRASYASFVPPEVLGAPLEANMRTRWDVWPAGRLILLAEQAGDVLGFVAAERGGVPIVDNLHVDPGMRGGGIGERLLRHIAARLRDEGVSELRLYVLEGNTDARRFYRRLGGQEETAADDTLLGSPVRMVPMHWSGAAFVDLASDFDCQAGKDA